MREFRAMQRARWEEDEGICQGCGCEGGQVHEVEPRGLGGTHRQFTIDDMVTLCQRCHGLIHDVGTDVHLRDGRVIGPRGFVDEP